jgi:lipopolysaccharide export system protein LptA
MFMRPAKPPSPQDAPPAPRRALGRATLLALCLGGSVVPAAALEGDQGQPLFIEADSVELDDIQDTSVYIGNVQIDQGSMRILADHVTVKHKEDRRPRLIVALGNPVRYRQDMEGEKGEVKAHAQRMEYDADKEELTLIDQAELTQAADRFASDRILYDRARSQVKAGASAQGSGRVKITFTPEKQPEAKPGAAPGAPGIPPVLGGKPGVVTKPKPGAQPGGNPAKPKAKQ